MSNSFRTLGTIGWQHAEPVLRSLAYALLQYDGTNPATSDNPVDRPGRRNAELVAKIRPDWEDGKLSRDATAHLLSTFRTASTEERTPSRQSLNDGTSVNSIWDAILAASGELLMRKTNILTLHSVTSSNALRLHLQLWPLLKPACCFCSRMRRSCRCSARRWAKWAMLKSIGSSPINRTPSRRLRIFLQPQPMTGWALRGNRWPIWTRAILRKS